MDPSKGRGGGGACLTIKDEIVLTRAAAIGTALVTVGEFRVTAPDTVEIHSGGAALLARVDSAGEALRLTEEIVEAEMPDGHRVRRLTIALAAPATRARITIRLTPLG